jgi:hypothetical protein
MLARDHRFRTPKSQSKSLKVEKLNRAGFLLMDPLLKPIPVTREAL